MRTLQSDPKCQKKERLELRLFLHLKDAQITLCQRFFTTANSVVHTGLGFDWSTGKKVQLCGHIGICCSWANKSEINPSICLLFVDLDKHTRNNNILLNLQTWLYSFIFFSPAFLLQTLASQISSELSGSPPTVRPSTPPNKRNNSLQGSPNLKYMLIVSLCGRVADGILLSHLKLI